MRGILSKCPVPFGFSARRLLNSRGVENSKTAKSEHLVPEGNHPGFDRAESTPGRHVHGHPPQCPVFFPDNKNRVHIGQRVVVGGIYSPPFCSYVNGAKVIFQPIVLRYEIVEP